MGMSAGFYDWIRASFDKGHVTKTGEFIACDFDYKAMSRREFKDALITEATFPALDGSSKEPAYMTVKLDPEQIRYKPGGGAHVSGRAGAATKKWMCSNFRVEIGDLPCTRLAKLDAFTWRQSIIKDESNAFDRRSESPTSVELSNLRLTLSMADWEPWQQWHKSFVIDGMCTDSDEVTGSITWLGPNQIEELASIDLLHVGIMSLETAGWDADTEDTNREEAARFTVELYVEEVRFRYQGKDD